MTTSHTAGPWESTIFKATNGDSCLGIKARSGRAIAWLVGNNDSEARLIAAAPDLLAALQVSTIEMDTVAGILWGAAQTLEGSGNPRVVANLLNSAEKIKFQAEAVRAAIAKATA